MRKTMLAAALLTGFAIPPATAECYSHSAEGWRPIATAPRDGTTIEAMETFGIAPWYDLFQWKQPEGDPTPRWVNARDASSGVVEDDCLYWRPYKGNTSDYTDPTGGAQNTEEYWRNAIGH